MRIIIAGSRDMDRRFVFDGLNKIVNEGGERNILNGATILCGEARGADLIGREYAEMQHLEILSYPAEWDKHGKSAGLIRNAEMAKNADTLIAFWDGSSKGTKHMIDTALKAGLWVKVFQR